MTLEEGYNKMHADYAAVKARLESDAIIYKFLLRYVEKNEMDALNQALNEKHYEDAFLYTHNMKGIGLNLSLAELEQTSSSLCELLRNNKPSKSEYEPLLDAVSKSYALIKDTVQNITL